MSAMMLSGSSVTSPSSKPVSARTSFRCFRMCLLSTCSPFFFRSDRSSHATLERDQAVSADVGQLTILQAAG
jgi:hypothetical protein